MQHREDMAADKLGGGWLSRILDDAERAGLREDPAALDLIRRVALCGDGEAGAVLEAHFRRLAVPHIVEGDPFFPPPSAEALTGRGGSPFGFCPHAGVPHLLPDGRPEGNIVFSGTVGCGKTTAGAHLAVGATQSGNDAHFDLPRPDCRALAKYYGFRLATVARCRTNPLARIKNVPRIVLTQTLSETFAHHFGLQTRGKQATARWLNELYGEFDKHGHEPCLADFVHYLNRIGSRLDNYDKECACRLAERFEAIISYTGEMLLCERGHEVEQVAGGVIFELTGVDPQVRDFLSEVRIRREFLYRQYNPEARRRQLFEIIDESLNLGRERRFSTPSREMSTASMDITATQARYHGMKLAFLTQVPSSLSAAIKGTAVLKLAGTTLSDQVYETARLWGLNQEQAEWLPKLPRGTFVARYSIDSLPRPYLLTFTAFPGLDEAIGEAEADEIAERSMADLAWTPRWEGAERAIEIGTRGRTRAEREGVAEKVFQRIAEHPDETCADRCAFLDIDTATESAARADLGGEGGRGLIELDGRVGNLIFFRLTPKGNAVATEKGRKVWRSHASPTHSWLDKECLKGMGQAGPVRILKPQFGVNGRRADRLLEIVQKCLALQICGSSNYVREASALLDLAAAPGVDMAVLVCTHRRHAQGVKKALGKIAGDVAWERMAVLDAAEVLGPGFDWRRVIGVE